MAGFGRALILIGIVIIVTGIGLTVAERFGWHRLPGDITLRRGNATFYFPIATSIVLSLILTLLLNLLVRRK